MKKSKLNIYRKGDGTFRSYEKAFWKMAVIAILVIAPWIVAYQEYKIVTKPTIYVKTSQNTTPVKVNSKIIAIMKADVVKLVADSEVNVNIEQGELFYTNDPQIAILSKCRKRGGRRDINCDSWGKFQYKIPTVQFYYKKLYGKKLTQIEAMNVALNETKATALAQDIIFKVQGGVWEWAGAQKNKSYLLRQIPLIRRLEKTI